ncbi:hypothetical protein KQ945_06255 [Bacillus subtilis subsp. subtilis]|nr:hypothetical protein [Bacillus subtilis subsp. subtilis]
MHASRVLAPLLLSVAVFPFNTRAAASLLVDDAGITDAHHCQLESWVRHGDAGQEWTAVPACTVANTEWSLGMSSLPGETRNVWALGAKRVLVERGPHRWGLAASAGVGGHWQRPRADDWDLNLPLTIALDTQGRALLHLNLGRARQDDLHGYTAGVGVELAVRGPWSLLAETARDAVRQRSSQFGMRRALWDGASVDLLAGRVHHQPNSNWLTLGFNLAATP